MNWFMQNKGPIGILLSAISAGLLASKVSFLEPWGLGLAATGIALVASGYTKSDQYYRDREEERVDLKKLSDSIEDE